MQDPTLIIPIRGPGITYLDLDHLKSHFNVTLVAENGSKIKVNSLQLAAFSKIMQRALIDSDEDITIATNLDQDDLMMVANFITEGLLPVPCEELKTRMPDRIAKTFLSFGILLKDVLNKGQVMIIKKEDLEELVVEPDQESLFDDLSDDNLPLILPSTKKKQKRVRKEDSDSKDYSEDWTPKRPAIKKKKAAEEVILGDKTPVKRWIILPPSSESNLLLRTFHIFKQILFIFSTTTSFEAPNYFFYAQERGKIIHCV